VTTPHHGIHIDETGPEGAPVVVLIHGSLDRSAGMARLARQLHGRFRVVRYDRRGYARSYPHDGPFSVDDQVGDLELVLNGRRAVLVGHSYGGNVALAASVRMPGQITAVSVYETPLSWMPWWPGNSAGGASVAASPGDAAETFMKRLIGANAWDALPDRTREDRRREGTALQGELSDLRARAPWEENRISVPVLCGYGSEGAKHHREGMTWLASHLPHARLVCLEGAGHGAPNSHATEFAAELVLPQFDTTDGISTS